jgi:hypothetical protein
MGVAPVVVVCVILGVALIGALVALVLRTLHASNLDRAVGSAFATHRMPFALRFTTSSPVPHRVWLHFDLHHNGGRYDYGVTAQLQLQVGSAPPSSIEMRVGATAPVLSLASVRSSGLVRASHYAMSNGIARAAATAKLAVLPVTPSGTPVAISGTVVVADGTVAKTLLVFVVPA